MNNALKKELILLCLISALSFSLGVAADTLRKQPLGFTYRKPLLKLLEKQHSFSTPAEDQPISKEIRIIQIDELRKLLDQDRALLLDVRPQIFYQLGHIPIAQSFPKESFEQAYGAKKTKIVAVIDQGKLIIVYCSGEHCADASTVASKLAELGYGNLGIFEAGWDAWENAGLDIKTEL